MIVNGRLTFVTMIIDHFAHFADEYVALYYCVMYLAVFVLSS